MRAAGTRIVVVPTSSPPYIADVGLIKWLPINVATENRCRLVLHRMSCIEVVMLVTGTQYCHYHTQRPQASL